MKITFTYAKLYKGYKKDGKWNDSELVVLFDLNDNEVFELQLPDDKWNKIKKHLKRTTKGCYGSIIFYEIKGLNQTNQHPMGSYLFIKKDITIEI
jgi:CRISPR/Cas system-associated endoribonuclease Cas2